MVDELRLQLSDSGFTFSRRDCPSISANARDFAKCKVAGRACGGNSGLTGPDAPGPTTTVLVKIAGPSPTQGGRGKKEEVPAALDWPQGWLSSWLPAWRPTSMSQLKNVEARILQCLQNKFLARYVSLPNQNKIWTVTVSPEQKDRTPLVMVHGFGGGVGLWILNMDSLSARRTLHTFDLLGFGRSSRPTFPRDPEGAEDEFVTSIETWRETMGIPSMILLGHSLGGFLATSYSIKYPERVKHLILVDPWGFPLRPTDPSEIRAPPTWVKAVASILGRSNPLAVLRVAGPWGPGLVQRFRPDFKRKFADFFEDDTISEYIYHCNAQNPSGETAFKAMMESFGWARRPMLERIHLIRKDVPITMIYGANTWIDTSTGKKVKMQRPDSYVRDLEIEGASHHVYADQPHIFNTVVEEICDSVD